MPRPTNGLLKALLESLGYDARAPAELRGKSGILHDFGVCASRGREEGVAIEVEESGRPVDISVLALYAKALDAGVKRLILVTDSPVTGEAMRLAGLYGMRILPSGTSTEELRRQLEDFLQPNSTVPLS
ncbi:MAG: hypothetical protein LYZ66_00915 [Nitrososphaerales archaeon]|nr:hypothetical protein [Nitrososphaerales archaeon]